MNNKNIDWLDGYMKCLYDYAVWQSGTMYVGCGIKTFEQARQQAIKEYFESKLPETCEYSHCDVHNYFYPEKEACPHCNLKDDFRRKP